MTLETNNDIHNLQEDSRNSRPTVKTKQKTNKQQFSFITFLFDFDKSKYKFQILRHFLENDPEGRMIVEVYDEKNSFNANTNLRDLLVRLIIRREKQTLIQNLKPNEKLDKFL